MVGLSSLTNLSFLWNTEYVHTCNWYCCTRQSESRLLNVLLCCIQAGQSCRWIESNTPESNPSIIQYRSAAKKFYLASGIRDPQLWSRVKVPSKNNPFRLTLEICTGYGLAHYDIAETNLLIISQKNNVKISISKSVGKQMVSSYLSVQSRWFLRRLELITKSTDRDMTREGLFLEKLPCGPVSFGDLECHQSSFLERSKIGQRQCICSQHFVDINQYSVVS